MINYSEKSVFDAKEDIIVHQVNCLGIMGCGRAKSIRSKYPDVYQKYKNFTNSHEKSSDMLGKVLLVSPRANDKKIIANLFGQDKIGRDKRYTDYDAVRKALKRLANFASERKLSVAIPYKMGCNNAGGDWNIVKNIIESVFENYPITIYKL